MTEKMGLQMVQDVRSNGPADQPKSEQKEESTVFEVSNDSVGETCDSALDRLHDSDEVERRVEDRVRRSQARV